MKSLGRVKSLKVMHITLTDPERVQAHISGFGLPGDIRRLGLSLR
jgi:hypothetical protein